MLREAIKKTQILYPFSIDAIVLLPEHLHCIWTLPENDLNYSRRWAFIKKEFTKMAQPIIGQTVSATRSTVSKEKHREGTVWQRRFWEHMIRNEKDYSNHIDYIHYNPVKHGLTASPVDWEFSSFHRFVQEGLRSSDWGANEDIALDDSVGRE